MHKLLIILILLIAASAMADTFNPNPITYRMNTLMVLDGSGGVPPTNGNANINQPSNGADSLDVYRFTDASPTGNYFSCINHANNSRPCLIDALGNGNFVGNLVGNGQVAAGTAFATGAVAGDITSSESTTVGKIFFGSNGNHSLGFDGTNYNLTSTATLLAGGAVVAGGTNPTGGPVAGDLVAARSATLGSLWLGSGGTTNGGRFVFNGGTYSLENPAGGTVEFKVDGSGNATSNGFMDAGSYLTTGTEGQHNGATINTQQSANGNDTVWIARNTDVAPTGFLVRGVNAAQNTELFHIDVTGSGAFQNLEGTNLKIDTGVNNAAVGLQHKRLFNTSGAGVSSFTLTWNTSFADNNYTAVCDIVDADASNKVSMQAIKNKLAASVDIVVNNTDSVSHGTTANCIGMHD